MRNCNGGIEEVIQTIVPKKRLIKICVAIFCFAMILCQAFPIPTPAFSPSDYYSVSYSGSLSGTQITTGGSLNATITGTVTCTADFLPLSNATVTGRIVANPSSIVLNPSYSVTVEHIPFNKGESASVSISVPLTFPADMAPGQYSIVGQVISASISGVDVTSYVPSDITLGEVTVAAASPPHLDIFINGNGTTNPPPGRYQYDRGSVVNLEASPDSGWEFVNWTGDVVANSNAAKTSVVMDGDKEVTANFTTTPPPTTTTTPPSTTTTTLPPTTTTTPPSTTTTTLPPTTTATLPPTTTTTPPTTTTALPSTTTTILPTTTTTTLPPTTATVSQPTTTTAPPTTTTTPPPITTNVSENGNSANVSSYVTASGEFINSVTVISTNNNAAVTIPAGITGTTSAGQPLGSIAVTQLTAPPVPPPTGENIVSSPYEFGPSGAHFSSPITMTLSYDPTTLASGVSETSLVIAYYSLSDGQWITLGGVVDTVNHTITVQVDHFTAFAVIEGGSKKPPVTTFTTPAMTTQAFITDVSLILLKGTEADISWATIEPSDTQVEYWASPHQFTQLDSTLVTEHSVHISGLKPDSVYTFKLMSRDSAGNLNTLVLSSSDVARPVDPRIIWGWVASIPVAVLFTSLVIAQRRRHQMAGYVPSGTTSPPAGVTPVFSPPMARTITSPPYTAKPDMPLSQLQDISEPSADELQAAGPASPQKPTSTLAMGPAAASEISVRLIKGSFTVTAGAALKLKACISPKHDDKYMAFRVTHSPSVPTQLRMIVEKQAPTDIVVVSRGVKILFLSLEAAELLDGVILDYQVTGRAGKFILSKKKPDGE